MKVKQSLVLISIALVSLLAISAVSAENNISDTIAVSDVAAVSEAGDSADLSAADDINNKLSANDVEKEIEEKVSAADCDEISAADDTEELSFGSSGKNTTFDFKNITFNTDNGTSFSLSDLLNGTFTLGNGTTFNFSSLGNGTISFGGNGTKFNFTDMFNSTGSNGTGSFDFSSIIKMFGDTGPNYSATTSDMELVYSGSTTFKATILDSNKTVEAGKDVIFTINNKDYLERTDANGTADVKLSLKPGTYYIYTEYNNEILAKNQITIKKASSKITAGAKSYNAKTKTKKYTITLKNNKGKIIKNAKVTLKVKGKTYTATTNSQGKATFKITKLTTKGNFDAKIKFAGNDYYKSSSATKKITVK